MHDSSSTDIVDNKKHMLVQKTFGYEFPVEPDYTEGDNVFAFEFDTSLDIALGYSGLMFYQRTNDINALVSNPNLFAEVAGYIGINIRLYFIDFGIKFHIDGYKIRPVDYQSMWNLDNKTEYCHSIGVNHSVFDFYAMVEMRAYECYVGLLGLAVPDQDDGDCMWYRYYPQLPLWSHSFMDQWDWGFDYYPWTCNYHDELDGNGDPIMDPEDDEFEP